MIMFTRLVHLAESNLDSFKYGLSRITGLRRPVEIVTYPGYGNSKILTLRGRVLTAKHVPRSGADDSDWKNFLRMSRNWFTDEIPHAKVEARLGTHLMIVEADEEGYFSIEIKAAEGEAFEPGWIEVPLRLLDPSPESAVEAMALVQVPEKNAEFGVISDIDDTVIHTGATSVLQMAKNTLLGNAHTRVVFDGVTAFYAALGRGTDGRGMNPFFYVTSSPWNLFGLITRVFKLRGIPDGTLFMKDWGVDENKFIKSGHHDHKQRAIQAVLDRYPEMKFVLIGDSGQEDPEIYMAILRQNPDRITAIYIRDVTQTQRDEEVKALATVARDCGIDLVACETSLEAAEHAASIGIIRHCELHAVRGQKAMDQEELTTSVE